MLDMIMPVERTRIALSDLRHCRMTPIFFDTFFNLEKYLDHEQRDPFASQRELDEDGNEVRDVKIGRKDGIDQELLLCSGTNALLPSTTFPGWDLESHPRIILW